MSNTKQTKPWGKIPPRPDRTQKTRIVTKMPKVISDIITEYDQPGGVPLDRTEVIDRYTRLPQSSRDLIEEYEADGYSFDDIAMMDTWRRLTGRDYIVSGRGNGPDLDKNEHKGINQKYPTHDMYHNMMLAHPLKPIAVIVEQLMTIEQPINEVEGAGMTDFITDRLKKRPLNVQQMLNEYGKNRIVSVSVCRVPITNAIKNTLNTLTRGQLDVSMKRNNYDNLFHLYMNMTFEDGSIIGIEKNQRVKITHNGIKGKGSMDHAGSDPSVCKTASVNKILNEFMANGEKRGDATGEFYRYSALKNNCQKFINDLLVSNGINHLSNFVLQDVKNLLPGFTKTEKVINAVTDAAAIADYLVRGGCKE
jgi:hypothetical protein